jgi:hypothetical protein
MAWPSRKAYRRRKVNRPIKLSFRLTAAQLRDLIVGGQLH